MEKEEKKELTIKQKLKGTIKAKKISRMSSRGKKERLEHYCKILGVDLNKILPDMRK